MEVADVELLRSPRLLAAIAAEPAGADPLVRAAVLRRNGFTPVESALVLTQARLRERARAKFGGAADGMLFTRAGLEQATRLPVAGLHAGRIAGAGITAVADLGCGIGGDALAFALAGLAVLAVERDPVTAALAAHNLAGRPRVAVRTGDALTTDLGEAGAAWLDPARRTAGHDDTRRTGPTDLSPSLEAVLAIARRLPTGVKLGPGFPRERIPLDAEAQWVSDGGETVELVLWFGALARPGVRRAALVTTAGAPVELTGAHDAADEPPGPLGAYLHEPAGAVLRARLMGDLARATGTRPVAPGIGYLTGDAPADSPLAASFRVEAALPFDRATIRRELRARSIGRLEVKKRGVDLEPAAFRRSLRLAGDADATLIVTPTVAGRAAVLCRRER